MSLYIEDCSDRQRRLNINWWNWRATVELLRGTTVQPEHGWDLVSDGIGQFTGEETAVLARFLETEVLPKMTPGSRVKLDGTITTEPDDGTFHRVNLSENYSAHYSWLTQFVAFLRTCKGGICVRP